MAVDLPVKMHIDVVGTAQADLKKLGTSVVELNGHFVDAAGKLRNAQGQFVAVGTAAHNAALEIGMVEASVEKASNSAKSAGGGLDSFAKGLRSQIVSMAAGYVSVQAAAAAVKGTISTMSAVEDGMVGVAKTTGLAGAELEDLKVKLLAISRTTPTAAADLLKIAETAGQLGIQGAENVRHFTETIARLAIVSDLAGEEAATILAQLMQLTDEPIENVDRIASAIVKLGAESNATESKIARFSAEMARATAQFDFTAVEVVGMSTAMAEIFNRPDEAASVFGRTLRVLADAARSGGADLDFLGKMTGMTGEQFAKLFAEDRMGATIAFLEGLSAAGEDGTDALEALGLTGDEVNKTLPVLAENVDRVKINLAGASKEFDTNTAAIKEANAASSSLTSLVTKLSTEWALFVSQDATTSMFFEGIKANLEFFSDLLRKLNGDIDETNKRISAAKKHRDVMKAANAGDPEAMRAAAGILRGQRDSVDLRKVTGGSFGVDFDTSDARIKRIRGIESAADAAEAAAAKMNEAVEDTTTTIPGLRDAIDDLANSDKNAKDAAREHAKALSEQERAAERAAREIERAAESVIQLNERYRREVESRTETGLLGLRDEDIAREVAALRAAGAAEAEIQTARVRIAEDTTAKIKALGKEAAEAAEKARDEIMKSADAVYEALGSRAGGVRADYEGGTVEGQKAALEREMTEMQTLRDLGAISEEEYQYKRVELVKQSEEKIKKIELDSMNDRAKFMRALAVKGVDLVNNFGNSVASTFAAMASGTKSASEAIREFGKSVVSAMTEAIAKMLVFAAIGAAIGFVVGGPAGAMAGAKIGASAGAGGGFDLDSMGKLGSLGSSKSSLGIAAGTAPTREPSSTTININAVDAPSFQALLARDGQGVIKGVMSRASLQPSYGRG